MNKLSELVLEKVYDPSIDGTNVVEQLYIPCLKCSIKYDRCSAYFSRGALISVAKGLEKFVIKGGKIRFIFSCAIGEEYLNEIINGYEKRMNELAENIDTASYELANLSYLIAKGIAEVKIAFMIVNKAAIMHMKFGIFTDDENNKLYFMGSGNETEQGLLNNAELIYTFTEKDNYSVVLDGEQRFNKMWNNQYSNNIITVFPNTALYNKLVSFNQNRIFCSKEQYFSFSNNAVFIDISEEKDSILIFDFTKNNDLLGNNYVSNLFGKKWEKIDKDFYKIKQISIMYIERLRNILSKFGIKYNCSLNLNDYFNKYNYDLDKRIKLGISIKTNINSELWQEYYNDFCNIVNNEISVNIKLKEQQLLNAFFHCEMKSSADFSVPGTGKTYISYALYAYLSSMKVKKINHMVVFGPYSCFKAWRDEGCLIFAGKRILRIFDVAKHKGDLCRILKKSKYDIYIFNYERFRNNNDSNNNIDIVSRLCLDDKTLVVFDEIHRIKNPEGVDANNILEILNNVKSKPIYKLALTGTPIPNSFTDIYNYLKILYPNDLQGIFRDLSKAKLKSADTNFWDEKEVREKIQPFFMRITKNDLKIPEPEPDDLDSLCAKPTDDENRLYQLVRDFYPNILEKYIRLIQASSNPTLLKGSIDIKDVISDDSDLFSKFYYSFHSSPRNSKPSKEMLKLIDKIEYTSKFFRTVKKIEQLTSQNKKVIVWCLFINTMNKLKKVLKSYGINSIMISGADELDEREEKLDEFKISDNINVLITNPNTMSESVSLHKECHHAIYLEYGFNLTYLLQSKDRIHRVGLKPGDKTYYYFAISKASVSGSIDEHILERLNMKADRMKRTVESNDLVLFKSISDYDDITKDIKEILNLDYAHKISDFMD